MSVRKQLIVLGILFSQYGVAQEDLIITDNDTIRNIEIFKSPNLTNFYKVSYLEGGKKKEMTAKEVVSFYRDNKYYVSRPVEGYNGDYGILEYLFDGEVGVYKSQLPYGQGFEEEIFVRLHDNTYHNLSPNSEKLDAYFSSKLNEYDSFIKNYDRKLRYTWPSITTMISHYNHFLNPKKYTAEKFRGKNSKVALISGVSFLAVAVIVGVIVGDSPDSPDVLTSQ